MWLTRHNFLSLFKKKIKLVKIKKWKKKFSLDFFFFSLLLPFPHLSFLSHVGPLISCFLSFSFLTQNRCKFFFFLSFKIVVFFYFFLSCSLFALPCMQLHCVSYGSTTIKAPITEANGRLLLQRFSAFTAENGL